VVTARRDPAFCKVLNNADMVAADGMPLVWMMHRRGFSGQPRVSGPDFMWQFCARAQDLGLGVYLYGGTPETLVLLHERLQAAYPRLRIVGAASPPFRPLSQDEQRELVAHINASDTNAVFVGLGCPKQERWMAQLRGQVQAVMFGVGAAFDYHAGTVKRAPPWMRAYGLEWLYRLASDPARLWRRYFITNSLFLLHMMSSFVRTERRR
jgi:N-acetylglucosaminyldiphosphoundecaprenol N-acetyl-beta-D-mannosaminyltransferase